MRQSWETMTSVSTGHIILTPTQPVGSGRSQWESNPGPPHQESRALPTELPRSLAGHVRLALLHWSSQIWSPRQRVSDYAIFVRRFAQIRGYVILSIRVCMWGNLFMRGGGVGWLGYCIRDKIGGGEH